MGIKATIYGTLHKLSLLFFKTTYIWILNGFQELKQNSQEIKYGRIVIPNRISDARSYVLMTLEKKYQINRALIGESQCDQWLDILDELMKKQMAAEEATRTASKGGSRITFCSPSYSCLSAEHHE